MHVRTKVWQQVDPAAYDEEGLSPANRGVLCLILVSSLVAILQTEPTIEVLAPGAFALSERLFGAVFLVEYVVRLWAEGEDPRYRGIVGRVRYALTPAAVIDLIALLPSLLMPSMANLTLLRTFRLLRILRLARLGRFSHAMRNLAEAVHDRREELLLSLMLAGMVLVFSAGAMYVIEGQDSPQQFGSIPRALWWSICTLTTVGYGDVYPHTILGKICSGLTSIAGIGLIAMPTGILAAAFSQAFQKTHKAKPPQSG
jgi:voltage-gated potassium channel